MRLVKDEPATPRVWQVCFMGLEKRFWWDRFLQPGFRHVFLLGYVPEHQIYICYDVLFFKTEITILSPQRAGFLLNLANDQGDVLNWPAPVGGSGSWGLRFGMWCVPAVCHLLGLRCVAMTPKGLHDYLLRHNAPRLVEESREPVFDAQN